MEITKEKEPLVLSQHRNPEIKKSGEMTIRPPEPLMTVVYKNGKGNRVEEGVTISSFGEAGVVQKIKGEIKALQERLELIPSQLQEIPNRKHGGRLVPKSEQTQRRERLAKEMISIPDRIIHREGMIKQLKTILTSSDPLEPVQLEVNRAKIRILEGKGRLLSEEGQEFWRYVREKAPEIYRHMELGQRELFQIIYSVFVHRLNWQRARNENRKEAENKFYRFIEGITEEEYKQIDEDLKNITQHFTGD